MAVIPGPALCPHGRLSDGCEECALVAAMERGYRHPHEKPKPAPEPERAAEDLYLDRGDGRYVLVLKGDVIPPALAELPRVPRTSPAAQDPAGAKPASKRGTHLRLRAGGVKAHLGRALFLSPARGKPRPRSSMSWDRDLRPPPAPSTARLPYSRNCECRACFSDRVRCGRDHHRCHRHRHRCLERPAECQTGPGAAHVAASRRLIPRSPAHRRARRPVGRGRNHLQIAHCRRRVHSLRARDGARTCCH